LRLFGSKRENGKSTPGAPLRQERSPRDPSARALAELAAELPEELRRQAFTHYTWAADDRDSYKRLAFIGDSVLGLLIAEELHARFPDCRPRWLAQIRARVVSGISCGEVGQALGIPSQLEAIEEPRLPRAIPTEILLEAERPMAEITEALIGGAYLTFGFERTRSAVLEAFEPQIQAGLEAPLDPKSALQQLLGRRGEEATYEVLSQTGTGHSPTFEVAVNVDSRQVGKGSARTKKAAERAAAEEALVHLDLEREALELVPQTD
jgi:ribonuclease-3